MPCETNSERHCVRWDHVTTDHTKCCSQELCTSRNRHRAATRPQRQCRAAALKQACQECSSHDATCRFCSGPQPVSVCAACLSMHASHSLYWLQMLAAVASGIQSACFQDPQAHTMT